MCVCVIGTRQRRAIKSDLRLIINIYNEPVPIVDSFNYLGVTIDNSLSWKQHVNILSSSLGRRVGILALFYPNIVLLPFTVLLSNH